MWFALKCEIRKFESKFEQGSSESSNLLKVFVRIQLGTREQWKFKLATESTTCDLQLSEKSENAKNTSLKYISNFNVKHVCKKLLQKSKFLKTIKLKFLLCHCKLNLRLGRRKSKSCPLTRQACSSQILNFVNLVQNNFKSWVDKAVSHSPAFIPSIK